MVLPGHPFWCQKRGAPLPNGAFSLAADDVITSQVDHPQLIASANCLA